MFKGRSFEPISEHPIQSMLGFKSIASAEMILSHKEINSLFESISAVHAVGFCHCRQHRQIRSRQPQNSRPRAQRECESAAAGTQRLLAAGAAGVHHHFRRDRVSGSTKGLKQSRQATTSLRGRVEATKDLHLVGEVATSAPHNHYVPPCPSGLKACHVPTGCESNIFLWRLGRLARSLADREVPRNACLHPDRRRSPSHRRRTLLHRGWRRNVDRRHCQSPHGSAGQDGPMAAFSEASRARQAR